MVRRYNKRGKRTDSDLYEEASVFTIQRATTTIAAGDYALGWLKEDCEFIGGFFEQGGDEGTNGTAEIETWTTVTGGTETTISNQLTLNAGAAAKQDLSPASAALALCAAGVKLNLKIASCTGAVPGYVTLYFRRLKYTG